MWKRSSKTSGYKNNGAYAIKLSIQYTISLLFLFLIPSCAPKHIEMPYFEDVHFEEAISDLKRVSSIDAIVSVEYKNKDNAMSGDAILKISEDSLHIRLYYLGFLAGEIYEENGIIKSNPRLDRNKGILLVDGLKNSFFWWDIKDYFIEEDKDTYILKNSYREVIINKKTLLPVRQTLEVNGRDKLIIYYSEPSKIERDLNSTVPSLWYNSRLNIEFSNHSVDIKIKSYAISYKSDL